MNTVAIRIIVAMIGICLCWAGVRTVKVMKLDGVRVLPIWSRTLMVIAGLLCIYSALLGEIGPH